MMSASVKNGEKRGLSGQMVPLMILKAQEEKQV